MFYRFNVRGCCVVGWVWNVCFGNFVVKKLWELFKVLE